MKKIIFSLILSTLLLFQSTSYSEITWSRYEYFNNVGGLNDAFSPIAVEDNEASNLQNVVFTTSGNWKTRDGTAKLNSSSIGASVATTGLKYYKQADGDQFIVGVFSDDTIRKMDYGLSGPDGTWDDVTGALSFAVDQDNLASFAVGEDILIIEDGLSSTAPYKWTGTGNAAALGGSPPNATVVAFHKNMAFAAGNSSAPSTLYFSDLGDIENWTTGLSGNISVETNDGSIIRALIPGFDALYIFKDTSIWRLTGDDKDTFQLQRMISNYGVLSTNAVSVLGNDFIITTGQGDTYLYDGAVTLKLISTKVQGTINDAQYSRLQYCSTVAFDKDYYLAFTNTGGLTNDRILFFDTYHLAWSKFTGINANVLAVADDGTGKDVLIFGDYSGFVYKYPSGTDDAGTSIATSYTTKYYRFPQSSPTKDWKLLRVFANQKGNYSLSVETRKDFEGSGTENSVSLAGTSSVWGTAVFGVDAYGGQNLITGRIEVNTEGDFFQIEFSNDTQPIEVKGWQIFIENQDKI